MIPPLYRNCSTQTPQGRHERQNATGMNRLAGHDDQTAKCEANGPHNHENIAGLAPRKQTGQRRGSHPEKQRDQSAGFIVECEPEHRMNNVIQGINEGSVLTIDFGVEPAFGKMTVQ